MTFEEASQIYYINKEIQVIKLDLARLEEKRTFSKAITYSDMPKGPVRDATEDVDDYLTQQQELKEMLNYSLKKLQQERLKMEKFLDTITDAELRLIIRLRCINNMTWREIGSELNCDRTTVLKKFYKFWNHNKEKGLETQERIKSELKTQKECLTIRPLNNIKSGVVELESRDSILVAKYIKDDDFRKIVKSKKMRWDSCWYREINRFTGNIEDRAAELGNALLTAGFTVRFFNNESMQKAINGDFVPEQDRWIKWNDKAKKISISWDGWNDTLYDLCRKLPGAKWSNGSMKIPIEFYAEVQDFAETMGFSTSEEARRQIEFQIKKENGYKVENVRAAEKEHISDNDRLRNALKSSCAIIEDLKDEDVE